MTRRVQNGEPLEIHAKDWNKVLDGLESGRGAGAGRSLASRQSVTVEIRNDTGVNLERFGIFGLGAPIILPSDNESEFLRRICLSATNLSGSDLKWGITLQPLAKDAFGVAVVQGLCFAKLDDATAQTAMPRDFATLTKADCGLARVIWRAAGAGPQWAIVCLG